MLVYFILRQNIHSIFDSLLLFHMPKSIDDLEEIDSEYKGTIIKKLSDSKAAEALENMPNDQIANLLNDLDERK